MAGTASCIGGIQVIAWKTNFLQKAVKVSDDFTAAQEQLLKKEKSSEHSKYLIKLFGGEREGREVIPGLN